MASAISAVRLSHQLRLILTEWRSLEGVPMEPDLDFPLLDDILPVGPELDAQVRAEICSARPRLLGPLTEYAFHAAAEPALPLVAELQDCPAVRELRRILS